MLAMQFDITQRQAIFTLGRRPFMRRVHFMHMYSICVGKCPFICSLCHSRKKNKLLVCSVCIVFYLRLLLLILRFIFMCLSLCFSNHLARSAFSMRFYFVLLPSFTLPLLLWLVVDFFFISWRFFSLCVDSCFFHFTLPIVHLFLNGSWHSV